MKNNTPLAEAPAAGSAIMLQRGSTTATVRPMIGGLDPVTSKMPASEAEQPLVARVEEVMTPIQAHGSEPLNSPEANLLEKTAVGEGYVTSDATTVIDKVDEPESPEQLDVAPGPEEDMGPNDLLSLQSKLPKAAMLRTLAPRSAGEAHENFKTLTTLHMRSKLFYLLALGLQVAHLKADNRFKDRYDSKEQLMVAMESISGYARTTLFNFAALAPHAEAIFEAAAGVPNKLVMLCVRMIKDASEIAGVLEATKPLIEKLTPAQAEPQIRAYLRAHNIVEKGSKNKGSIAAHAAATATQRQPEEGDQATETGARKPVPTSDEDPQDGFPLGEDAVRHELPADERAEKALQGLPVEREPANSTLDQSLVIASTANGTAENPKNGFFPSAPIAPATPSGTSASSQSRPATPSEASSSAHDVVSKHLELPDFKLGAFLAELFAKQPEQHEVYRQDIEAFLNELDDICT